MEPLEAVVHYFQIGLAVIAGLLVLSSLADLVRYGPRAYIRSAFEVNDDSWRLVTVLLLVGFLAMTSWGAELLF